VSTFYFDEAHTGFLAHLHTFWAAVGIRVKVGVNFSTPNTGDLIDIATGQLSGTWTDGSASSVSASGSGSFAQGVGARISWATSGIRGGRRVRGATFVVPLTVDNYDADGTLGAAYRGTFETAAAALVTSSAGNMRVYSRPGGGLPGQENAVIGSSVKDTVSWLRSRRT